jgi:hypothetical protein
LEGAIPQRGKSDREFKGTGRESSSSNAPKTDVSSPEKVGKENRSAPEEKRSSPRRGSDQDRQFEQEKKEQQRGGRGKE